MNKYQRKMKVHNSIAQNKLVVCSLSLMYKRLHQLCVLLALLSGVSSKPNLACDTRKHLVSSAENHRKTYATSSASGWLHQVLPWNEFRRQHHCLSEPSKAIAFPLRVPELDLYLTPAFSGYQYANPHQLGPVNVPKNHQGSPRKVFREQGLKALDTSGTGC